MTHRSRSPAGALAPALALAALAAGCHFTIRSSPASSSGLRIVATSADGTVTVVKDGQEWVYDERAEGTRQLALELGTGELVRLTGVSGSIDARVVEGETPRLVARLEVAAPTAERAAAALDAIELRTERGSRGTRIVVETPDRPDGSLPDYFLTASEFDLSLPPGTRLELATSSGGIEADGPFGASTLESSYGSLRAKGIRGAVVAKSASGAIDVRDVQGGSLEARTSYGKVEVADVEVDELAAVSSSGNVTARRIVAATSLLKSNYGAVEATDVRGDCEARTASGSVELSNVEGGEVVAHSNYGRVHLVGVRGDVKATAASGRIDVDELEGAIEASSSYGSVTITGVLRGLSARSSSGSVTVTAGEGSQVASPWSVHSDYGSVRLTLPPGTAFDVSARTGYGSIETDFPVLLSGGTVAKQNRLEGTVHGGGETIELTTSNGAIHLSELR